MLCNWKSSASILVQIQSTFASGPTSLHLVVSGELINLKSEVEVSPHHISSKMTYTQGEYAKCFENSYNKID
jgi:hypothetical protein